MTIYTALCIDVEHLDPFRWQQVYHDILLHIQEWGYKDHTFDSRYDIEYRIYRDCIEIEDLYGSNFKGYRIAYTKYGATKIDEFVMMQDLAWYKGSMSFVLSDTSLYLGKVFEALRDMLTDISYCVQYEVKAKQEIEPIDLIEKLKKLKLCFNSEFKAFLSLNRIIKELFLIYKLEDIAVVDEVYDYIFEHIDHDELWILYALAKCDHKNLGYRRMCDILCSSRMILEETVHLLK